ncbi:MAG TPA: SRPBCC family protein [Thermoanaerobaculia bacterium]|nr:SRPBCC family protein [Thermoanaerobaculia bacterium]
MKVYELKYTQDLPRPRAEVFEFFADPHNLEKITPPWLHFEIQTPMLMGVKRDTQIDYRLRLHGIPLRWTTEITAWDPPRRFVDQQMKGPYRLWIHEHHFHELPGGGTRITDEILYAPPFGALANWLLVDRDLKAIFKYRQERLVEILGSPRTSTD